MNPKLVNIIKSLDAFLDARVSKLEPKIKLAICLTAWAVPAAAFFFLVYTPKSEEIGKLESRKTTLADEIRQVEKVARELDKHKAEQREVEIRFQAASLLLPGQKEIPSLLTNISGQGINSGLEFLSFKPQNEAPKEFYAEIPVDIAVEGTYHNVGVFLDKISKLPRIVTVNNLNLGSPSQVDKAMLLKTTFTLVTYRFIEPKPQENAKQPKKKK